MPALDINWFRVEKGFDPNIIRKSLERRYRDPTLVDRIIEMDQEWRKSKQSIIQQDTALTRSKKSGTISARLSETRRKQIKKILVLHKLSLKMQMRPNKRLLKTRKKFCCLISIN